MSFPAPLAFIGDELTRTADPAGKIEEIASRLKAERFAGALLQIHEGDIYYPGGNLRHAEPLRGALAARGLAFGTWAQHVAPALEVDYITHYGARLHVVNIESAAEDARWAQGDINALTALRLPLAIAFTEAAWGRDPARSKRWRDAGFAALPEANQPENPKATPTEMVLLARALGWPDDRIQPIVYLFDPGPDGYRASSYSLAAGFPGWHVWRYAGINLLDWMTFAQWPRSASAPPEPPPASGQAEALAGLIGDALASGPPLPSPLARAVIAEVVKNWRRGYAAAQPLHTRMESAGAIAGPENIDSKWSSTGAAAGKNVAAALQAAAIPRLK